MDITNLIIEKGVRIPRKRQKKSEIGEFVERMAKRDSVWFKSQTDAMALWHAIVRDCGGKGASLIRKYKHPEFGDGWRVWRVK